MRAWAVLLASVVHVAPSLLSGSHLAKAQDYGPSLLAVEAFDTRTCRRAKRMFRGLDRISFPMLWKSFRKGKGKCLTELVEEAYYRREGGFIEIHFANFPRLRTRQLAKHELFYGETVFSLNRKLENGDPNTLALVRESAREITDYVLPYADKVSFALAIGPEHNLTPLAYKVLWLTISEVWPYAIVNSPEHPSDHGGRADYREYHGLHKACTRTTIINNDGTPVSERNWRSWFFERSGCRAVFLWVARWQGIHGQGFVRLLRRTFRVSRRDSVLVNKLLRRRYGPKNKTG